MKALFWSPPYLSAKTISKCLKSIKVEFCIAKRYLKAKLVPICISWTREICGLWSHLPLFPNKVIFDDGYKRLDYRDRHVPSKLLFWCFHSPKKNDSWFLENNFAISPKLHFGPSQISDRGRCNVKLSSTFKPLIYFATLAHQWSDF